MMQRKSNPLNVQKAHTHKTCLRDKLGSDDGVLETTCLLYIHEALGSSVTEFPFPHRNEGNSKVMLWTMHAEQ